MLAGRQLLERRRDEHDARAVWVQVTPAGHRLRRRIRAVDAPRRPVLAGAQADHSGTALGVVVALQALQVLLIGPYGGVVADRVDRRRLMIIL